MIHPRSDQIDHTRKLRYSLTFHLLLFILIHAHQTISFIHQELSPKSGPEIVSMQSSYGAHPAVLLSVLTFHSPPFSESETGTI